MATDINFKKLRVHVWFTVLRILRLNLDSLGGKMLWLISDACRGSGNAVLWSVCHMSPSLVCIIREWFFFHKWIACLFDQSVTFSKAWLLPCDHPWVQTEEAKERMHFQSLNSGTGVGASLLPQAFPPLSDSRPPSPGQNQRWEIRTRMPAFLSFSVK